MKLTGFAIRARASKIGRGPARTGPWTVESREKGKQTLRTRKEDKERMNSRKGKDATKGVRLRVLMEDGRELQVNFKSITVTVTKC